MINISRSTVINRPVEEVFEYVSDASRIPEWRKEIVATTGPKNVSVGTEFVETVNFMGESPLSVRVRELVPNQREVLEIVSGPAGLRPVQTFEFERQGNSTKVSIGVTIRTSGLFRIMQPIFRNKIEKNWEGYLVRLKEILEK